MREAKNITQEPEFKVGVSFIWNKEDREDLMKWAREKYGEGFVVSYVTTEQMKTCHIPLPWSWEHNKWPAAWIAMETFNVQNS